MSNPDVRNDYFHCVDCSRAGAVRVLSLWNEDTVAFDRFNADHTDMWMKDESGWHCPNHAHIAAGMERDEFERLRDSGELVEDDR